MTPSEYLYTSEHEWVRVEDDRVRLGITDFAQEELGEVVFVELPSVGDAVAAGAEIGTIESVKAVAELFTPVSGEVVAVNDEVVDRPEVLNDDPYDDGWLVEIVLDAELAEEELGDLMDADAYERYLAGDA